MAQKGVAVVVGRAAVDPGFRRLLHEDPHSAFEGYELTGEEKQALASMDRQTIDQLAASLLERMKKWYVSWAAQQ
jgi:hypothetical protein